MTEHGIGVSYERGPTPGPGGLARIGSTTVHFADHPTRDRAVMYGIVKELIFMLEHGKLAKPLPGSVDVAT